MHPHTELDDGFSMLAALMGAATGLFLLALALGALWLLHRRGLLAALAQRLHEPRPALAAQPTNSEAEAYLDMALAKGEIDVAEYHERRSAMRAARL